MGQVYNKAVMFKRKYPGGVIWRLKKHCEVVEQHLNPWETVSLFLLVKKMILL